MSTTDETPSDGTVATDQISVLNTQIGKIDDQLEEAAQRFAKLVDTDESYLLLTRIDGSAVDDAFDVLRNKRGNKRLAVIIESPGGDIHAAYNMARLFRSCGTDRLVFAVPRWAKSAATLISCAGDEICMTPVAELGPLDPQLTVRDTQEGRREHFSPLHIESTLELIRSEFEIGQKHLAEALVRRLQYPMTLGSFKKLLEVSQEYTQKLLQTRMLKGHVERAIDVSQKLATAYPDHAYCINSEEAAELGLVVNVPENDALDALWSINQLLKQQRELDETKRKLQMLKDIHALPKELREKLAGASVTRGIVKMDDGGVDE